MNNVQMMNNHTKNRAIVCKLMLPMFVALTVPDITIAQGGSSCTFPGAVYFVGEDPRSVATGDLDGDLDLDLVRANGDGISVLLNQCVSSDPFVVVPESFDVTHGNYVSVGLQELGDSDNTDLSLLRAVADIQSRTEFEVKAVSPLASPASLEVTLEGSDFARSQVNQTIELFDYVAGDWEQVDTSQATRFTDSTVTVAAAGDLSRFVQQNTMAICTNWNPK